ncbi:hypothetical protein E2C01_046502 [Portunus trituberculatus]|uniref:Uncharacterized protein n=1 Tax=Portunus trituberculatus TaxID=210409 RepID=A0A5B7G4Y7_PORTR|nr:hypothetical protein [Portunus trituberculatus]
MPVGWSDSPSRAAFVTPPNLTPPRHHCHHHTTITHYHKSPPPPPLAPYLEPLQYHDLVKVEESTDQMDAEEQRTERWAGVEA